MWKQSERKDSISIHKKPAGAFYEGIYQGNKTIQTQLGDAILWNFMDDEDKPFAIWGFTNLNFQLEGVVPGTKCKVTYLGTAKQKNKFGKFPHQAKVEVWHEEDDGDAISE